MREAETDGTAQAGGGGHAPSPMEGVPPPPAPRAATMQRRAEKRPAEPSLDYENFGTSRRCLWRHSQPTFRRNPDFISHL
eukprot:10641890-Lingulodinium_polyedra.AAC.1